MAFLKFNGVGISSISACIPPNISYNSSLVNMLSKDTLDKLINTIGINEKRYVDDSTCSSDLCFRAAEKLISDNGINKDEIDILLFMTLMPDYVSPPTSVILQERLGLSTNTACMDLSMACSGYIYALSAAYAYATQPFIRKVLVLVGETMSKVSNKRDRVNFPLYGDAGTACIVEKGDFGDSFFMLDSDGRGEDLVKIPFGGFRNRVTPDNLIDKEREEGNFRKDTDITMDGMATFDHAIVAIPRQVKKLMKEINITNDDIDYVISHQANKMMVSFIMKRLKVDLSKVPFCLEKYGNTSCASIPLTIVSELSSKMGGRKRLLLSAIGAGWSYATAYLSTIDLKVSEMIEY